MSLKSIHLQVVISEPLRVSRSWRGKNDKRTKRNILGNWHHNINIILRLQWCGRYYRSVRVQNVYQMTGVGAAEEDIAIIRTVDV